MLQGAGCGDDHHGPGFVFEDCVDNGAGESPVVILLLMILVEWANKRTCLKEQMIMMMMMMMMIEHQIKIYEILHSLFSSEIIYFFLLK